MIHGKFTRTILLPIFFICTICNNISGQNNPYVIALKAKESGSPLVGATVVSLNSNFRAISDSSGFVSIPESIFHKGERIEITMIGFKSSSLNTKDLVSRQSIELEKDPLMLEQVIVTENHVLSKVKDIQMGTVTISAVEARKLPSIFGEVDIIKLLQLKPGVKTA